MLFTNEQGTKLSGFFRGQVLARSNNGMGRCKVFIYGVYPDYMIDFPGELPDCEQASPLFGGINNGNGMFSYPNIGSVVWCFFENEDQNRPVYFASTLGDATKSGANFANIEQIPDDDDGAYLHKIQCGGSVITISEVGNVTIETNHENSDDNTIKTSRISLNQSGAININTSESVTITTDAMTVVSGKKLELNSGIVKIKASDRLNIASPRITIDTKFDSDSNPQEISKTGENSIRLHSDTIDIDATEGGIITKTLTTPFQSL